MKRSESPTKIKHQTTPSLAGDTQPSKAERLVNSPSRQFWLLVSFGVVAIFVLSGGLLAYRNSLSKSIAELRSECERARRKGDWPEMERFARLWASLEPGRVAPWTMAAAAARAMGDLELCAKYLSQLPDSAPAEAFHELSLLQIESLVQPLAARETCQRAIRQYPSDGELSLRLLFIHAMLCDRDAVLAEAERAIRSDADSRMTYAYWVSAKWLTFANGHEINRFWLEKQPDDESFAVAATAHQMANRDLAGTTTQSNSGDSSLGSKDEARKLFETLFDRYPKNKELLAIAMNQAIQSGDIEQMSNLLSAAPPEIQR